MANNSGTKATFLLAGMLVAASGWSRPQQDPRKAAPAVDATAEEEAPASHVLYESERIHFSAPPPMIVMAGTQCDANGNIYVAYTGTLDQATLNAVQKGLIFPISKVAVDSKRVVQFPAGPLEGYASVLRISFYVDPNGKVYGLMEASHHDRGYKGPDWSDRVIVKYKDDGTVDSVVKLEPPRGEPDHFVAVKFAALLDGNFLVTGSEWADKYTPTKPLTGIFDRSGTFVAPLSLPHDVGLGSPRRPRPADDSVLQPPQGGKVNGQGDEGREPESRWAFDVQQGLIVGSLDGNIYLLRASSPAQLYVISTAGVVLRELEVKPPEPGMRPIEMSLAGQDELLLKFVYDPGPLRQKGPTLALLDLGKGKITDTYHLPPNTTALSACATRENEFLFLGTSKDNHLEVVKYVAR